jgi:hypothetical protein
MITALNSDGVERPSALFSGVRLKIHPSAGGTVFLIPANCLDESGELSIVFICGRLAVNESVPWGMPKTGHLVKVHDCRANYYPWPLNAKEEIMDNNIIPEVIETMSCLPRKLQEQALDYIRELKTNHETGISGKKLLRFAGSIPNEDLKMMSEAIEKDCGRVDLNEW